MKSNCVVLPFIFFVVSLQLIGCDSEDSTGPDSQTQSSLSFILNGQPWSNTAVEMDDNRRGIWLIEDDGTMMAVLDAFASVGGTSSRRIVATITIPKTSPGPHAWIDPQGAVLSDSGIFLDIYESAGSVNQYQAVEGSTTLSSIGDVGDQVEGTFSGTMRSATDGSIITISNGSFSLTRLQNQ